MRVHCRSRQSRQSCRALHLCTLRTYLKPQRYSKVPLFRTLPQASSLKPQRYSKSPLIPFRFISSFAPIFLAFNPHSRCMDSLGFAYVSVSYSRFSKIAIFLLFGRNNTKACVGAGLFGGFLSFLFLFFFLFFWFWGFGGFGLWALSGEKGESRFGS